MSSTPNTRAAISRGIASFAALVLVYSFANTLPASAQARRVPGGGAIRPRPSNPNFPGQGGRGFAPSGGQRGFPLGNGGGTGGFQPGAGGRGTGGFAPRPSNPNFPGQGRGIATGGGTGDSTGFQPIPGRGTGNGIPSFRPLPGRNTGGSGIRPRPSNPNFPGQGRGN